MFPAVGSDRTAFTVRIPNVYRPELGEGNYHVLLQGPGGKRCSRRLHFAMGFVPGTHKAKWVYGHLTPGRSSPAAGLINGRLWCGGRFTGRVEFRDFSVHKDYPVRRPAGKFTFTVR